MRFVFSLCEKLGIDDPVEWFNTVPPVVVDRWLAYRIVQADESPDGNEMMNPEDALRKLGGLNG